MPWHIEKRGSKFVVIKDDDGEIEGRHETRRMAERQLRALYASETKDMDDPIIFGGSVKAQPGGLVAGYLITYGDESAPDQSHYRDFFTAETDFDVDEWPAKSRVLYAHGMDPTLRKKKLPRGTMKTDERGVWIEAQLDLRDEWEAAVYGLAQKEKLSWSSGTAAHRVEREAIKDEAGKVIAHRILSWPLGLDASLTPTPAEPRCAAVALKSLALDLPEFGTSDPRPSLAEWSEQWQESTALLIGAYQSVADAEIKIGRKLSAARRERLTQMHEQVGQFHTLLADLLAETEPREEAKEDGADDGAATVAGDAQTVQAALNRQRDALSLRTRAALILGSQ